MIGVFDSGCGGLSVYREIRKALPRQDCVFYADNAYCPYGEKSVDFIQERCRHICNTLIGEGAQVIVVACNTATSAAISMMRSEFPVRFIGMEPAVKPAALSSRSGVIGILATACTLKGDKYHIIKEKYEDNVRILESVGIGWVELVERGVVSGPEAEETVRKSLEPLLESGADNIVLGCTHYPFLLDIIRKVAGPAVTIIDPAPAVARHLIDVMREEGIEPSEGSGSLRLLASGSLEPVRRILRII